MSDPTPPSDEVLAEASTWLARLHADDRRPEEEEQFRIWLSASPDHTRAFEAVDHSWSVLGGVPRTQRVKPAKFISRRKLVMSGTGLAVIAAGSLAFMRSSSAKVYETGVGEQKHISLDDGSRIFMNAQTRLTVLLDESQRIADLEYGRANFLVTADDRGPFVVKAAQRRIIGEHCKFDVRREGNDVEVVLIDGTAKIVSTAVARRARGAGAGQVLHTGDRLVSVGGHMRLDHPDLTPLLAWQAGRAIFDNEPLVQAVREMNLYSSEKLEVADAAAAQLRVSGVYHVGDNVGFARSIAKLLPVSVNKEGDRLVLGITDTTSTR